MASADRTYVDPSALRSLFIHDDHSFRFCTWRRRIGGTLVLTRHGYGELVNAVALAVFRRDVIRDFQEYSAPHSRRSSRRCPRQCGLGPDRAAPGQPENRS